MSDSWRHHELQHARPPCPSPTPGVHPNPCPSSRWCHPTNSSSVIPFSSRPQFFGSIPWFFLELFLHWSPVAYWAPTDLGSSSFSILSFCLSYCSWGSQGKNTEVICHSLLQWTTFCQTSPPWPICLGWPHTAWLSFTELDKAVVHVIRLASCLWLWFQSVCPLISSLSAYRLTWVSLTLRNS